jgi:predicted nucleotidyltransferase
VDLTRPITAVVATLDGPVLQTLARTTRPLTGRQVHQLSSTGSEAGVRRVLDRLVTQGLVHATRSGQALLYVANREHLAWPAVEKLTTLRETFLDRLRASFRSWPIKPVAAALFGSAARGDGTVDSDIDVLVVGPQSGGGNDQWQEQLDSLREQVSAWTGNRCQIYDLNMAEFDTHVYRGESIVAEWKRDAVPLYGDTIAKLVTAAANRGSS